MSEYSRINQSGYTFVKANNCLHMQAKPTCISEGGLCMNCEKYVCYRCIDSKYLDHVTSTIGQHMLSKLEIKKHYGSISESIIDTYASQDMLVVCWSCVEELNHPSCWNSSKYYWQRLWDCCCPR